MWQIQEVTTTKEMIFIFFNDVISFAGESISLNHKNVMFLTCIGFLVSSLSTGIIKDEYM